MVDQSRVVELVGWSGPWADDDPDANFKRDVALYAHVDPLTTIRNLGAALDNPGRRALPLRAREMGDRRQRRPSRARPAHGAAARVDLRRRGSRRHRRSPPRRVPTAPRPDRVAAVT